MRTKLFTHTLTSLLFLLWPLQAQCEEELKFRVVTFNVWGLPGTPHKERRLSAIPEALKGVNADLVAIQELWDPRDFEGFESSLATQGFKHVKRFESWTGGGLLVASRFPILKSAFQRFSLGGNPKAFQHGDFYAGKGIGVVLLDTPLGPLAFANTHIHASYGGNDYEAEQISQLLEVSDVLGAPELEKKSELAWVNEVPLIFVGDINRRWDTLACELLQARSHLQPAREKQGIDALFFRSHSNFKLRSLGGRAIFTEEWDLGNGIRAPLSDHAGVYADFQATRSPQGSPEWSGGRSWEEIGQDVVVVVRREVKSSQLTRLFDGLATLFLFITLIVMTRSRAKNAWLRRGAIILLLGATSAFALFTLHDHHRIQELNLIVRKLFQ